MTAITSEELLPFFSYSGNVGISESAPVNGPTNIVRTSEAWFVKFDWTATGWLNFFLDPLNTWNLQVLLEQMGPGEFALPGGTATVNFVQAPNAYSQVLNFAPGSVPSGLYRASAILTLKNPTGVPARVTGFADLGLIEFYDAV